jgi:hypothetical protein
MGLYVNGSDNTFLPKLYKLFYLESHKYPLSTHTYARATHTHLSKFTSLTSVLYHFAEQSVSAKNYLELLQHQRKKEKIAEFSVLFSFSHLQYSSYSLLWILLNLSAALELMFLIQQRNKYIYFPWHLFRTKIVIFQMPVLLSFTCQLWEQTFTFHVL